MKDHTTGFATATKPRFEVLDGLRGVAAAYIVLYHLFEGCGIVLGHGYLGVDFFYALSGFVIGYAYDGRWGAMSTRDFFTRRIVRLHPMVAMGMILGLGFFYFGESAFFPRIAQTPWWKALLLFLYCSLMLPMPNVWDVRGWQDTNSFNGNMWSLQWEYFVNVVYAFVLRRLPTFALAVLAGVAALGTLDLALNVDVFDIYKVGRYGDPYTINGGWSLTAAQLYIGAVRLFYPFLAGLVLSRVRERLRLPGNFWLCSLLVVGMMATPKLDGVRNGLFEAGCVLILLPLVVALGAGCTAVGRKTTAVCRFLGEISYPLYVVHMPLAYMQMAWVSNHPNAPTGTVVLLSAAVFVLSVALAFACSRLYDLPLRRWLTGRLQKPAA